MCKIQKPMYISRFCMIVPVLMFILTLEETAWSGAAASSETTRLERARAYFGDAELFDQDGVRHRFVSDLLDKHVVLINVVYTECRDACPLITRLLGQVMARVGDDFGRSVLFLSISSDPPRYARNAESVCEETSGGSSRLAVLVCESRSHETTAESVRAVVRRSSRP